MNHPVAYGIDFGTTNSSISIAYGNGHISVVDIEATSTMPNSLPSICYLHRDDDNLDLAGRSAIEEFLVTGSHSTICGRCSLVRRTKRGIFTDCKQYQTGGGCQDSRLVSGLKGHLVSQIATTHSWANTFELEDLVAVILGNLKNRADELTDNEIGRVVVGYPVVFAGAEGNNYEELQDRALARVEGAAKRAGFFKIELLPEPAAVLLGQYLDEGFSLAVDFGGGTYDVAVLAIEEGDAEVVALQGAAVGGEIFDALIFDNALADAVGINQLSSGKKLPKWISQGMRTLTGIPSLLRDKNLLPALHLFADGGADISIIDEILRGGQAFNFYKTIERAKIDLSEKSTARIDFHFPDSGINISQEIRRKDFENWISPYLDKVDEATMSALDEAGIEPGQVHTVLRTGGSSQIPQFINRLEKMFPKAEIRERPAFTSVAYGLGIHALEVWGND